MEPITYAVLSIIGGILLGKAIAYIWRKLESFLDSVITDVASWLRRNVSKALSSVVKKTWGFVKRISEIGRDLFESLSDFLTFRALGNLAGDYLLGAVVNTTYGEFADFEQVYSSEVPTEVKNAIREQGVYTIYK